MASPAVSSTARYQREQADMTHVRPPHSLSPEDQQQLLVWLKTNFGSVQVVATTERPLLELVESAKFDPALYYALNVVYIKLPS